MTNKEYDRENELSTKSEMELEQLKETLDRQLTDLAMAGVELPGDLARRFEQIQMELARRRNN